MMTMYSYKHGTQEFNDIIDEAKFFAIAKMNKEVIADLAERVANHDAAIVRYCVAGTRFEKEFEEKGLEICKDPRFQKNTDVLENYNVVIAEIINAILPEVAARDLIAPFAEIRQVGWGDTAKFIVESNELYKVNEIAEGVNRGVLQPIFNNEVTVNTVKTEVAASIDWYPVAAGVFNFGDFGYRYARSFEQYLFLKVVKALAAGATTLGAAYNVNGFSNANYTTLVERISAANGGSDVYVLGTLTALSQVIPSQVGLQYGLGKEIADNGHLDKYIGAKLIPINQVFAYNTINTTGALAIPDDVLYFVPVYGDKAIKIVVEGNSSVVERDPDYTPDRTYRIRIQEYTGVQAVIGSKFGRMTLVSE